MSEASTTTGVQELIDRLSEEGVAQGQQQADAIVRDAQLAADKLIESARQKANEIVEQARQEADQFRTAGEEALKLAARDAIRDFGSRIHEGLRHRLQQLVQDQMADRELMKTMILEVTRQQQRAFKAILLRCCCQSKPSLKRKQGGESRLANRIS